MLKFYEYLYYRLYIWNKRMWSWDKSDGPELNASLGIAMLMGLQTLFIIDIVNLFLIVKYNIHDFLGSIPKKYLIGVMVIYIAITFFWFPYKKKYLKIVAYYKEKPKSYHRKKGFWAWSFVILPILLIIITLIISKQFME